jgi:hypothetical protein
MDRQREAGSRAFPFALGTNIEAIPAGEANSAEERNIAG